MFFYLSALLLLAHMIRMRTLRNEFFALETQPCELISNPIILVMSFFFFLNDCLINMKNERDVIRYSALTEKMIFVCSAFVRTKRRWPENISTMSSYTCVRFIADKSVIIVLTNCCAPLRSPENGYTNKTALYGENEVSSVCERHLHACRSRCEMASWKYDPYYRRETW